MRPLFHVEASPMTPQQHSKNIRKFTEEKGIDALLSLRAASPARDLASLISDGDVVLWPEYAGGLAWKALNLKLRPSPAEETPGTIYLVFGPDGPAHQALWNKISRRIAESGINLVILVLTEAGRAEAPQADETNSEKTGGWLPAFLYSIIEKLESTDSHKKSSESVPHNKSASLAVLPASEDCSGEAKSPLDDSGSSAESLVLLEREDISSGNRLHSATLSGFESGLYSTDSDVFPLEGRCPLAERLLMTECLAVSGLLPIMPLRNTEIKRASGTVESLLSRKLNFVLTANADWSAVSGFRSISGLPILSPASPSDVVGAVSWIHKNGKAGLIIEPGNDAHAERNILKSPWESGKGIVLRESLKGSAGHILLIVPGKSAGLASKAADRLVRDNISVTILSMRYLEPIDTHQLFGLMETADITLVNENCEFPGDLKSTLAPVFLESGSDVRILSPVPDAAALAEKASGLLREQRIRRTVDDVKADRWR